MPNTSGLAVKVGIFVTVALVLVIGFSLQVTGGWGRDSRYELNAYFEDAVGVQEGVDVLLAGVKIGEVRRMAFDPQRKRVHAILQVSRDYQLPADSVAKVERTALLGGARVIVEYGDETQMLAEGGEIGTGRVLGLNDLIAQVNDVSAEAKELMSSLKDNQDSTFGKLETILEENREDIKRTAESFASAGPKLDKLATELTELSEDLRQGKGTLGKLFVDDGLYEDLLATAEEMKRLAQDVREGDGTLSRLIYDDTLIAEAEESLRKVGDAGEEIQRILAGKDQQIQDVMDSLANLGPKLEAAVNDINAVAAKINEGEGTMGRLVNDPALYDDARRAVNQVTESFEESEEQGIIRSFIGVLFGALI